jgi:carbon starvation protein
MHAMPLMIGVLCVLAIAYRYYSAFLAAKVAVLDDRRPTPAVRFNDRQNFYPTNRWVLFGHHFAAISGAGPLIGPVLAAQFGYMPGLLWIVIGVCLAGAVQDFLMLAASIQRNGRSLARITYDEIGRTAGVAAMAAILFILVIALAGLGKVVVKALGGETVAYPQGSQLIFPDDREAPPRGSNGIYIIPAGATLVWNNNQSSMPLNESFSLKTAATMTWAGNADGKRIYRIPNGSLRLVSGSPWGTFTIACTIPIALLIGFYMYRIRAGKVLEASLIGAVLTLAATFAGGWIATSAAGRWFNLSANQVVLAMAIYGFVASVLPVWLLLAPRDYLSSFLKIGTLAALVVGTILANPKLQAPAYNHVFAGGGPVVGGRIFPFLFITIMCGAISGFHALVSSGTTSKMISREGDARMIGYGAMLIEGLVGVVAMIAAASLPTGDYYAMNVDMARIPAFHEKLARIGSDIDHLNLYDDYTQESLRGRTGGAVTLAVGMAHIFEEAGSRFVSVGDSAVRAMWRYWYHFAIMFEALFILTTIDAGTRIGRFLLQEIFAKVDPRLGRHDSWPGTLLSTLLMVCGWAYFINANSFSAIWAMFGIANQMLAVIALSVLTVTLIRSGRPRYFWVTTGPLLFVATTTTTAALEMLSGHWLTISTQLSKPLADRAILTSAIISGSLIVAMLGCTYLIIGAGIARILPVLARPAEPLVAGYPHH